MTESREPADWVRRERSVPCGDCDVVQGQPCRGVRVHPVRLLAALFGGPVPVVAPVPVRDFIEVPLLPDDVLEGAAPRWSDLFGMCPDYDAPPT